MSGHEQGLCEICRKEDYEDFRHTCLHEIIELNKGFIAKYRIGDWPRWDYEMDDATLTFSENGEPRVICDMEVVGSTKGDTWEWSWGNEALPAACRSRMCVVHEMGTAKGWDRLDTLFLPHDESVGWSCSGIANHLLGGIGVYRCPNSDSNRDDGLIDAVYVVVLSACFVDPHTTSPGTGKRPSVAKAGLMAKLMARLKPGR